MDCACGLTRTSLRAWCPNPIPFCSLLAQDLGYAVHGPQVGAQSVMQALIIDARLSFRIGQRCLALDHAFGEPATPELPLLSIAPSDSITTQTHLYPP